MQSVQAVSTICEGETRTAVTMTEARHGWGIRHELVSSVVLKSSSNSGQSSQTRLNEAARQFSAVSFRSVRHLDAVR
jgi:hypothetical protein